MSVELKVSDLLKSNEYYLLSASRDTLTFVHAKDDNLTKSSFLDGRLHELKSCKQFTVPLHNILPSIEKHLNEVQVEGFLFHTGHVGSTLISKLIGTDDGILSLREPLPLRFLSEASSNLLLPNSEFTKREYNELFATVLKLLARPYKSRKRVFVKCSSGVTEIAQQLIRSPDTKSMLIYDNLDNFIANMFSPHGGLQDLGGRKKSVINRFNSIQNATRLAAHELKLGEIAGLLWATEILTCELSHFMSDKPLVALNFSKFLEDKRAGLSVMNEALRLGWSSSDILTKSQSELFNKYSKLSDSELPYDRNEIIRHRKDEYMIHIEDAQAFIQKLTVDLPILQRYL